MSVQIVFVELVPSTRAPKELRRIPIEDADQVSGDIVFLRNGRELKIADGRVRFEHVDNAASVKTR